MGSRSHIGRSRRVHDNVRLAGVACGFRGCGLLVGINTADTLCGRSAFCARASPWRHGFGIRLYLGAESIGRLDLEDRSDRSGGGADPRRLHRATGHSVRSALGRPGRRLRFRLVAHRSGARPDRPDVEPRDRQAAGSVSVRSGGRRGGRLGHLLPRTSGPLAHRSLDDAHRTLRTTRNVGEGARRRGRLPLVGRVLGGRWDLSSRSGDGQDRRPADRL